MNGKNRAQRIYTRLAFAGMALVPCSMFAQSDITGVMTSLTTYKDAAIALGVAILLFVLGRAIVRKIAK